METRRLKYLAVPNDGGADLNDVNYCIEVALCGRATVGIPMYNHCHPICVMPVILNAARCK